jgi:hypothetical protein
MFQTKFVENIPLRMINVSDKICRKKIPLRMRNVSDKICRKNAS